MDHNAQRRHNNRVVEGFKSGKQQMYEGIKFVSQFLLDQDCRLRPLFMFIARKNKTFR